MANNNLGRSYPSCLVFPHQYYGTFAVNLHEPALLIRYQLGDVSRSLIAGGTVIVKPSSEENWDPQSINI